MANEWEKAIKAMEAVGKAFEAAAVVISNCASFMEKITHAHEYPLPTSIHRALNISYSQAEKLFPARQLANELFKAELKAKTVLMKRK